MEVAPAGDGEFVYVTSTVRPGERTITRVGVNEEQLLASTPAIVPSQGEALIASEPGRWWYSRHVRVENRSRVFFVIGADGVVSRSETGDLRERPLLWLPVPGTSPAGLLFSMTGNREQLQVDEVTPDGVTDRGRFDWNTSAPFDAPSRLQWSVLRLGDDRLAVISLERSGNQAERGLMLRIFGGGRVTEHALPCHDRFAGDLSAASGAGGTAAVIGLSAKHEVVAMFVDVDHPAATECRILSEPGESAVAVSIVAADRGFIAAWTREDGTLRGCELKDMRSKPIVVELAQNGDTHIPFPRFTYIESERVIFVWKDRDGSVTTRAMPQHLTGYTLLLEVLRLAAHAGKGRTR